CDGVIRISIDGGRFPVPLDRVLTDPPGEIKTVWGIAVANALSEYFQIETSSAGRVVTQEVRAGVPFGSERDAKDQSRSGVSISFRPDREIFGETRLESSILRDRLEELASLHSGVRISFRDEFADTTDQFMLHDGILAYVERLNRDRTPLHAAVVVRGEE